MPFSIGGFGNNPLQFMQNQRALAAKGGSFGVGGFNTRTAAPKPIAKPTALQKLESQFAGDTQVQRRNAGVQEGQIDTAEGGISDAVGRIEAMRGTNVASLGNRSAGWNPSASSGVDLSGVGGWRPSTSTDAVNNFDPSEQRGMNFDGVSNFNPSEMEGFETGALDSFAEKGGGAGPSAAAGFRGRDFNAGAAVSEFSKAAFDDAGVNIKKTLAEKQGKAAASGRLQTGFWDVDQGDVITEINRGAQNAVASQAVNAAGITAQAQSAADRTTLDAMLGTDVQSRAGADRSFNALSEAARLKFNRAQGIDDSRQKAGIEGSRLGLERAQGIDRARQDAITEATRMGLTKDEMVQKGIITQAQLELDRGISQDKTTLEAAGQADRTDFDKASFQDDYAMTGAKTGLDYRDRRAGRMQDRAINTRDRATDMLTGGINREIDKENTRRAEAAAKKKARGSFIGGLVGGVGGFLVGGPAGAAAGYKIGSNI